MTIELPDFNQDVKLAEANINEHDKRLGIQATDQSNGNAGLCAAEQSETAGDSAKRPSHELGLFGGISNDEYHRSPGIGSTGLKPAIKSLNLYHETASGRVPFKQTEAMFLGSAVHALTLEAYDFGNQVVVSKKFKRTKEGFEEKAEFQEAHAGKIILSPDDYERCQYMRDSLLNLEEVRRIFSVGKAEISGYYMDNDGRGGGTSMLCKYRADWENYAGIFDIKSTRDASAEAFSKQIHNLKYHLSAAHYLEGSRILTGQSHNQFTFLCVESEAPYEAAVYVLGEQSLEEGMRLRRIALDAIKIGRQTDDWALLNDGVAQFIDIPSYALNELRLSKI